MPAEDVLAWLKSQNIIVPNDWVAACVDFVKSENRNASDFSVLKKLVYEQWLLTDLADLEQAALPANIKNEKYVLKGSYCLQINSLIDATQPKYSQLQKIQKKENSNTLVTAETQYTQKPWEVKPSRMLMLEMTDGVTNISGMEYNAIPKLNERLQPGTKVRIKGPVTCRRGVLMLNQSNVEVLGGEVEDLFATNNYEAVLCKALKRPVPTHPTPNAINRTPQNIGPSVTLTSNPAGNTEDCMEMTDETLDELMSDIDFEGDNTEAKQNSCGRFFDSSESKPKVTPVYETAVDDVIMIDSDLEDFLNDAENEDDFLPDVATSNSSATSSGYASRNDTSMRRSNGPECLSATPGTLYCSGSSSSSSLPAEKLSPPIIEHSANALNVPPKKSHSDLSSYTVNQRSSLKNKPCRSEKSLQAASNDYGERESCNVDGSRGNFQPPFNAPRKYETTTCSVVNASLPTTTSCQSSSSSVDTRHKVNKVYICEAKRRLSLLGMGHSINISVKAVVITLLSKLKYDLAKGWNLCARICDGTAMLDIEFSNEVLETMIGFTVAEAERVKRSGDADDCSQLKEGIDNCRETIITMCHYMNVKMEKSGPNVVTDIKL